MTLKYLITLLLALVLSVDLLGQEELVPLSTFPHLNGLKKDNASKASVDPVKLPFIDDFSSNHIYPNPKLWASKSAFVSKTFAINPPTQGVLTFDAMDDTGAVYAHASQFAFIADTFYSNPIRLDSIFASNSRNLLPSDSVYLSFYFQPQGLGNAPDLEDSLILQFFNPSSQTWEFVWHHQGMPLDSFVAKYGVEFLKVMIPIKNIDYFSSDFRFRFLNKASIPNNTIPSWKSGMYDQWHLDYVYLNYNRAYNENSVNDMGIISHVPSLLKNYISMPWNQYKANAAAETSVDASIKFQNFYIGPNVRNVNQFFYIHGLMDDSITYSYPYPSAFNMTSGATNTYAPNYNNPPLQPFTFYSTNTSHADFEVMFYIYSNSPPLDIIQSNDTLRFYQRFYNYYAYDDGTPEAGYGLSNTGARLAVEFNLNQPDSLQAVQIYFNQTLSNASQQYFFLTIWDDQNGKPGNVIYEQSGLRPVYENELFQFHNYPLDKAIYVSGKFYVGFRQTTVDNLNIGFDKNNNKKTKIFYNSTGSWLNSSFEGSLMIRPILGNSSEPIVNIQKADAEELMVKIFPNPVNQNQELNIKISSNLTNQNELFHYRIFDISGREILNREAGNQITIGQLAPGLYIVNIKTKDGRNEINQKFIVR